MQVGIAGVGGIGSNVAVHLVRAGCTSLRLVDFDRVELSNLNRQFYFIDQLGESKVDMLKKNLLNIDPGVRIETLRLRLTEENMLDTFADCQVLVEGFDDQASKKLLVETFADRKIALVAASGIAGSGLAAIGTRRLGNCTLVGDFCTDFRQEPLYGPKIAIIAAMMADHVLQVLDNLQKGCFR